MTSWLLDTNVLSELRRPRPERKVVAFIQAPPLESLFVSPVALAEIRFGIERVADPTHRAALADWLSHTVRPMFDERVLEISEDVMLRWRLLVEAGRLIRHTFSQPDLIIAATALHHGMTVVTRNTADFARANVPVTEPVARSRRLTAAFPPPLPSRYTPPQRPAPPNTGRKRP